MVTEMEEIKVGCFDGPKLGNLKIPILTRVDFISVAGLDRHLVYRNGLGQLKDLTWALTNRAMTSQTTDGPSSFSSSIGRR